VQLPIYRAAAGAQKIISVFAGPRINVSNEPKSVPEPHDQGFFFLFFCPFQPLNEVF
jgi:hypothetical protein